MKKNRGMNGRHPGSPMIQRNTMNDRAFEEDFVPARDLVLIKLFDMGKTKGGIALPEGVNFGPRQGRIIKVGPGVLKDDGEGRFPVDAKEGQDVYLLFQGRPPAPIEGKDAQYMVVAADSIMGTSCGKSQADRPIPQIVGADG